MNKTEELRIFTRSEAPNDEHPGWVTLVIDDINNLFTETELDLFKCFLFAQKQDQFSKHAGRDMTAFVKGGGITEYKKEYFDIDFIYPLDQKDIQDIKNRTKEMLACLAAKKKEDEDELQLSSSDASILESIIGS